MTPTAKPTTEVAAYWREARMLYTVYSSLLERFALGLLPCRELESPIDRSEPDSVQNIQQWLEQMDDRVQVHQLRQLLQTSRLGTEDNLRSLVNHHLQKDTKTESDRDKVDFLLVQYLSSCAPPGFYDRDVEFDEVAQVLEPILGEVGLHPPSWLDPLNEAAKSLDSMHSLRDLLGVPPLRRPPHHRRRRPNHRAQASMRRSILAQNCTMWSARAACPVVPASTPCGHRTLETHKVSIPVSPLAPGSTPNAAQARGSNATSLSIHPGQKPKSSCTKDTQEQRPQKLQVRCSPALQLH